MVLNELQRQVGKDNFRDAARQAARGEAGGLPQAGGTPIRFGVIGTGAQGRTHIEASQPDHLRVVACSDIRPSNIAAANAVLAAKYGPQEAATVKQHADYRTLLADSTIQAVIIALPLHLHAPVTLQALAAGKHVLCEAPMAKTATDCKKMVQAARKANKFLAVGCQRRYNPLYTAGRDIIAAGMLGDIKHVRAVWHRNPTGSGAEARNDLGWNQPVSEADAKVDAAKHGYASVEELVRWRLYNRTSGGLVVELGSHQLGACAMLLGDQRPVAVAGMGTNSFFEDGREIEDHVFLTVEYPAGLIFSYSAITTNAYDAHSEQVMGTKGTLLLEAESNAYLFREGVRKETRTTAWGDAPADASGNGAGPASGGGNGLRDVQSHLAALIGQGANPGDADTQPAGSGTVGLHDAVAAIASTVALREKRRVDFQDAWFDADADDVPDPT